ncbi:MAG TPA: PQQ-binding-like beta-propeller repeat protein [Polyangium sp.]|nr:PQQ-binding-like beta-propeller repeat protein [Polyangium sp.]
MGPKSHHFITLTSLVLPVLASCSGSPAHTGAGVPAPASSASAGVDPCVVATNLRAKVKPLLDQGRLHRTVEVLKKADRLCPASAPTTWATLVTSLVELGNYSEARTLAAKIDADPRAPGETRAAASTAKAKCDELDKVFPDTADAKKEMHRLLTEARTAESANDAASLSIAEEKYLAAWSAWRPNGEALMAAGRVAMKLGQAAQAQRLFDRALADMERHQKTSVVLDVPNGFTGPVHSLAWSPDGRRLAVAHGRNISFFGQNWVEVARFTGHTQAIQVLAFSPDGQTLASGSFDHTIWLWNASTGEVLKKLEGHTQPVLSLDYAPDGKTIVSAAAEHAFRFWDASTGNTLRTMEVPNSAQWAKYSPDGKTLALVLGNQLNLLEVATNKLVLEQEAYSAAFAPNGQWIAATDHNDALWLRNTSNPRKSAQFVTMDAPAHGFGFAPDNKAIAVVRDKTTVRILHATTGAVLHTLTGHTDYPRAVRFSPDGKILATGGADRTVRLWDTTTGKLIHAFEPHASSVNAFAYAPDGKSLISGSNDKGLRWWDFERGQLKSPLTGHSGSVKSVVFAPDGHSFASGSTDLTARIWDATNGRVLHVLEGHTDAVSSLAYAPNGKVLATGSADRSIRIWELATGKQMNQFAGNISAGYSILYSPDGGALASAPFDSTIRILDLSTGQINRTYIGHYRPVIVLAAPPNGTTIASGSLDQTIRIWDVKTSQTSLELKGHTDFVHALAYSPDGQKLASGSADHTVRLWNSTNGELIHSWEDHFGTVFEVGFSPNGEMLVSSGEDGSLQWRRIDTGETIATVRAIDGHDVGYVFAPSGHFDFLGPEACAAASFPVCRIGSLIQPFALCAERFYEPGLLRKIHDNSTAEFNVENVVELPCDKFDAR